MSEKLHPHNGESLPTHENGKQLNPKHEQEPTKQEREHGKVEQVEVHRNKVESLAKSSEEHSPSKTEKSPDAHPVLVNKQLKDMAFARAMTRARKKLPAPSRVFSKVVHQPTIDAASEFVGKTVARPSGMLGGAVVAFLGSSILLWVTRHYGYEYNYFAVILLFGIGLAIGLSVELIWRFFKHRQS